MLVALVRAAAWVRLGSRELVPEELDTIRSLRPG